MSPRKPIDEEAFWMMVGLLVIIVSFFWGYAIGYYSR
jgi:hypothetical protein